MDTSIGIALMLLISLGAKPPGEPASIEHKLFGPSLDRQLQINGPDGRHLRIRIVDGKIVTDGDLSLDEAARRIVMLPVMSPEPGGLRKNPPSLSRDGVLE